MDPETGCEICAGEKGRRGRRGKLGHHGVAGPRGPEGIMGEIGLPGFVVRRCFVIKKKRSIKYIGAFVYRPFHTLVVSDTFGYNFIYL